MELEPNLFFASPPFLVKSSMPHLRAAFDLHSDLALFYRRQPTMPIAQRMVFAYTVRVRDGKTHVRYLLLR
jgi:hypothetical protein